MHFNNLTQFLLLQGIKQHNPAAYVLNKTLPKHRLPPVAGTTATTKPDALNTNTEAATVCCQTLQLIHTKHSQRHFTQ